MDVSGSWPSIVTPDTVLAGVRGLGSVFLDADAVWWVQSDPSQAGRASLWRRAHDQEPVELTPEHYLRTGVHEYGGGEVDVRDGVAVFSAWPSHQLFTLRVGESTPTPITAAPTTDTGGPYRYGDLRVHPDRDLVLAVREDHGGDGECVNTLVALRLSGDNADGGRVLAEGVDFYASPELSSDDRLAWIEWDHPQMPWDATRLRCGRLDPHQLTLTEPTTLVDGGASDEALTHPRWAGDDLIVLSDRSGWTNAYRFSVPARAGATVPPPLPLCPIDHDFAGPMWMLGDQPYAIVDDRLVCRWLVDGRVTLGTVPLAGGQPTVLSVGAASVFALVADAERIVVGTAHDDRPAEILVLDPGTGEQLGDPVVTAADHRLPDGWTSVAQSVWWEGDDGGVQGWYYPPTNPEVTRPDDPADTEPPVLIVKSHGGPTSMSPPAFRADIQYWTSRGYAMLDVNYGGSTGFGRAYRQRLTGRWGIVDVADCIGGARAMIDQGRAHPDKVVITGGSAGGFTTLAALTGSDVFAAGVSLFGVADLGLLAEHTHKFESRYLDGLVGPWPEARAVYDERSPINQVDRLSSPMLLLQGTDDKVVPPEQAEVIADAVRERGLPVSLILYEGEGHGFRRSETIRNYLESMQAFLGRVIGFTPADELPEIAIDNLPAGR